MEFLYLRPAAEGDREILFHWRNDPVVRHNSFHQEPVAWEDHARWFARLMEDPQARQYILMAESTLDPEIVNCQETADSIRVPESGDLLETAPAARDPGTKEFTPAVVPVGQIRLNACGDDPSAYEISYSVAAEARGKGYGRRMLQMIKEQAPKDLPRLHTLIGRVKKDNPASIAAFRSAGYDPEKTQPCYVFRYLIPSAASAKPCDENSREGSL